MWQTIPTEAKVNGQEIGEETLKLPEIETSEKGRWFQLIMEDIEDRGKQDFLGRSSRCNKRLAVIREMWLQMPHDPESS